MNIRLKAASCIAAAVAVLCCLAPGDVHAGNEDARIRGIVDASIRPLMVEHDVPGMAVAVTIDGRSVFLNYGVASKED